MENRKIETTEKELVVIMGIALGKAMEGENINPDFTEKMALAIHLAIGHLTGESRFPEKEVADHIKLYNCQKRILNRLDKMTDKMMDKVLKAIFSEDADETN